MFLAGGARFCPEAVLIYNGVNSFINVPSRSMLWSFLRHSAETHRIYIFGDLPLRERFEVLRFIGRNHYPYIRHLYRNAIKKELGG
jgi:hypothetical protein